MIRGLRTELFKVRRRFLWLLPIGVTVMEFIWIITNDYLRKPEVAAEGYANLLFQLPLMNTIFLPLVLAAMASRICDAENKGNTYKLLCTMQKKGLIFDCKLLLGALYIAFLTLLEALNILLLGRLIPVTQTLPVKNYVIFLGVLFVVSLVIYLMQQILSLALDNQLVPLFVGLIGSLVGVFAAFFPIGSVANFLPWGYYMVGTTYATWYNYETRESFLYEIPFPWLWMAGYALAGLLLYFIGKHLFLKKEV